MRTVLQTYVLLHDPVLYKACQQCWSYTGDLPKKGFLLSCILQGRYSYRSMIPICINQEHQAETPSRLMRLLEHLASLGKRLACRPAAC